MQLVFQIDGFKPAATVTEIDTLREAAAPIPIPIPSDYLDVIAEMTDVDLLANGKKHPRIWGPMRCVEMHEAYEIQNHIPLSLAAGDN